MGSTLSRIFSRKSSTSDDKKKSRKLSKRNTLPRSSGRRETEDTPYRSRYATLPATQRAAEKEEDQTELPQPSDEQPSFRSVSGSQIEVVPRVNVEASQAVQSFTAGLQDKAPSYTAKTEEVGPIASAGERSPDLIQPESVLEQNAAPAYVCATQPLTATSEPKPTDFEEIEGQLVSTEVVLTGDNQWKSVTRSIPLEEGEVEKDEGIESSVEESRVAPVESNFETSKLVENEQVDLTEAQPDVCAAVEVEPLEKVAETEHGVLYQIPNTGENQSDAFEQPDYHMPSSDLPKSIPEQLETAPEEVAVAEEPSATDINTNSFEQQPEHPVISELNVKDVDIESTEVSQEDRTAPMEHLAADDIEVTAEARYDDERPTPNYLEETVQFVEQRETSQHSDVDEDFNVDSEIHVAYQRDPTHLSGSDVIEDEKSQNLQAIQIDDKQDESAAQAEDATDGAVISPEFQLKTVENTESIENLQLNPTDVQLEISAPTENEAVASEDSGVPGTLHSDIHEVVHGMGIEHENLTEVGNSQDKELTDEAEKSEFSLEHDPSGTTESIVIESEVTEKPVSEPEDTDVGYEREVPLEAPTSYEVCLEQLSHDAMEPHDAIPNYLEETVQFAEQQEPSKPFEVDDEVKGDSGITVAYQVEPTHVSGSSDEHDRTEHTDETAQMQQVVRVESSEIGQGNAVEGPLESAQEFPTADDNFNVENIQSRDLQHAATESSELSHDSTVEGAEHSEQELIHIAGEHPMEHLVMASPELEINAEEHGEEHKTELSHDTPEVTMAAEESSHANYEYSTEYGVGELTQNESQLEEAISSNSVLADANVKRDHDLLPDTDLIVREDSSPALDTELSSETSPNAEPIARDTHEAVEQSSEETTEAQLDTVNQDDESAKNTVTLGFDGLDDVPHPHAEGEAAIPELPVSFEEISQPNAVPVDETATKFNGQLGFTEFTDAPADWAYSTSDKSPHSSTIDSGYLPEAQLNNSPTDLPYPSSDPTDGDIPELAMPQAGQV